MRIGVTITKSTLFRGVEQEFHNTYYFNLSSAVTAPSNTIVDELKTKETPLHSTAVTFKRAQVWTAGGTPAQNQMIFQKNLAGTGSQNPAAAMDRERALLIQWKAGFDTRGLQVYLRKWYHSCGDAAGQVIQSSTILGNTTEIEAAKRTAIASQAEGVRNVGGLDTWTLTSKTGRETTDPAACHRYLEHHQLGDMWR